MTRLDPAGLRASVLIALLCTVCLVLGSQPVSAEFTAVESGTQPVERAALDWIDYDRDGDLDGTTVAGVKSQPDGVGVECGSVVLTADLGGRFYVESEDRSCGIQVRLYPHGLAPGMKVSVAGAIQTDATNGERYISASSAGQTGTGSVGPVGLTNAALGGSDWLYDPATGAGQKGVKDGIGLNNIGLLVRAWGRVTYQGFSGPFFYMDDGSGAGDLSGRQGVLVEGMWVPVEPGVDPVGKIVRVEGISSCMRQGANLYRRILATDVIVIE
jgi:hypothetical protein